MNTETDQKNPDTDTDTDTDRQQSEGQKQTKYMIKTNMENRQFNWHTDAGVPGRNQGETMRAEKVNE